MDFAQAQGEMRLAHRHGAIGVMLSGMVWGAAGLIWMSHPVKMAFAALFVGGMAIYPLSVLLCRTLLAAPAASAGNPLNRLGLESSFVLFAGLLVAFLLLFTSQALAIPVFAIIMGARYFSFATIYGDRTFWPLAALIILVGASAVMMGIPAPAERGACCRAG